MDIANLKPKMVKIDHTQNSEWNCDKCLFFIPDKCECRAVKRLLFGEALKDNCDDGKNPFVLINKH